MIFVTLGSQKFQFNRLLERLDILIETGMITEALFAQTGSSDYIPKHYEHKAFLDPDEFEASLLSGDIVLTHGGAGTIIGAIRKGKKVIAVPRLARYGEHVDDHQIQIITQFESMNLICACMNPDDLPAALQQVKAHEYCPYHSDADVIINSVRGFISQQKK